MSRAGLALLLLATQATLAGCGVKGPPRASGAPDKSPPSDLFRPADDSSRPGVDSSKSDQEAVQAPAPPATPAEEPAR